MVLLLRALVCRNCSYPHGDGCVPVCIALWASALAASLLHKGIREQLVSCMAQQCSCHAAVATNYVHLPVARSVARRPSSCLSLPVPSCRLLRGSVQALNVIGYGTLASVRLRTILAAIRC